MDPAAGRRSAPDGANGCWGGCSPGTTALLPVRPTAPCATPSTCRPAPDVLSTGRSGCPAPCAPRSSSGECGSPGATRRGPPSWRTPVGTWWWRPARRRGSRWPTSCRCCRPSPPTGGRPRCTSRRPRRWPPTSCGRSPRSGSRTCGPPPSTATPRSPSATGPASTAGGSSATRTCCTARCFRSTAAGPRFLRRLRYVVLDECHTYRGVFGSHVALLLRRLLRVCARYGARPTIVLASATVADPAAFAARLTGRDVVAVADDGSPAAGRTVALWEPPLLDELTGENGAPVRRSAGAESGRMLADLVVEGARTLAFVRSRRGAELTALGAQRVLAEVDPALVPRVSAYRGGYLPEERRALEAALVRGELLGVATTNALELGVDIAGLDAVVVAGFPGTRASFWQQAGRAGRGRDEALVVLVARDDPLDTYLVHHPDALLGAPVEGCVLDPANPYVLGPASGLRRRRAPSDGGGRGARSAARRRRRCWPSWWRTGCCAAGPGLVLAVVGAPARRRGGPARGRAGPGGRGRGRHRPDAGHRRGRRRAGERPSGRGLPAPGRELRRRRPRSGLRARPGARRRAGLAHRRPVDGGRRRGAGRRAPRPRRRAGVVRRGHRHHAR